jgi:DNA-binding response OmpR family regulator
MTTAEILKEVWDSKDTRDDHLVQVNISRLRMKLGDTRGLNYIQTRPGAGYVLVTSS